MWRNKTDLSSATIIRTHVVRVVFFSFVSIFVVIGGLPFFAIGFALHYAAGWLRLFLIVVTIVGVWIEEIEWMAELSEMKQVLSITRSTKRTDG